MITQIELEEMRFYAYHGVSPQERKVGNHFVVTLRLTAPLEAAIRSGRPRGYHQLCRRLRDGAHRDGTSFPPARTCSRTHRPFPENPFPATDSRRGEALETEPALRAETSEPLPSSYKKASNGIFVKKFQIFFGKKLLCHCEETIVSCRGNFYLLPCSQQTCYLPRFMYLCGNKQ